MRRCFSSTTLFLYHSFSSCSSCQDIFLGLLDWQSVGWSCLGMSFLKIFSMIMKKQTMCERCDYDFTYWNFKDFGIISLFPELPNMDTRTVRLGLETLVDVNASVTWVPYWSDIQIHCSPVSMAISLPAVGSWGEGQVRPTVTGKGTYIIRLFSHSKEGIYQCIRQNMTRGKRLYHIKCQENWTYSKNWLKFMCAGHRCKLGFLLSFYKV